MRRPRPATVAVIAVIAAGACWGLGAVIAKTAFDRGVPPARMAEARVAVALLVLGIALAWARRDLLRPPRASVPMLVAFGLCVAGVNFAYYVAIDRLAVGVAISLQYTGPVLLLALAAATSARKPSRPAWVAGGLTLVGAVLVSGAVSGLDRLDAAGLAAALVSAVLFAGYLLTARSAGRRGAQPATVLLWGFVVAVAAWSVAAPWWSWPVNRLSDPRVALSVVGVGVIGTLVPFFLTVGAVRILSSATAGIAATVEPPFAAGFAWLFLSQGLTPVQLLGGACVLAGVILAQRAAMATAGTVALEASS